MITRMRMKLRHDIAALGDDRGAAIVEFAIIFPVLIILLFGMIDFGRAFFLRNNLVAAAREGSRFGAVRGDACTTNGRTAIAARTSAYIVTIGGAAPTGSQLSVTTPGACAGGTTTNIVVSIVQYPFVPITPVFRLINYNTNLLRINVSATYRWELSTP